MFPLMKKKSVKVWFGVNKNGTVVMFADEPIRDEENGRWMSKYPFVNSAIYPQLCKMAEMAKLTFESEIQFMEFVIE